MIPLPPPDPVLGRLEHFLDGHAMAEVFNRLFAGGTNGSSQVRACRPYYARYKPEKKFLVQHELDVLHRSSGSVDRRLAHVCVHPPKRAKKLAARHGLESSTASAGYIGELHAIAQIYPVDVNLPGLSEGVRPEGISPRLSRALGFELSGCAVELVRYKAGKRAVVRYRLDGAPLGAVYGKFRNDDGITRRRIADALREAGVSTPETLAVLSDIGMVVQAEGDGSRLRDLRGSAAYEEWMPAVAESLYRLHNSPVQGLEPRSGPDHARELLSAAEVVGRLLPQLEPETRRLAERLTPVLAATGGASAIHGSFHDDQVIVGEGGIVFIDLDSAAIGNPRDDVAHFASYLSAAGLHAAYDAFLESYMALDHGPAGEYLALEAASLLRWATLPFRELRPDWPEAVEHRVRRAADCLNSNAKLTSL